MMQLLKIITTAAVLAFGAAITASATAAITASATAATTAPTGALKSGATVKLAVGPQPLIQIIGQNFNPPVTIIATGADVKGLRIYNSSGIIWTGGTIRSPGGRDAVGRDNRGIDLANSQGITFSGITVTESRTGIVVNRGSGLVVRNARFAALRSDGIDLASTNNVLIENNVFEDFHPVYPVGVAGQPGYVAGDHPDAVQMWADSSGTPVTDVQVRNNVIRGNMQGINTFGSSGTGHKRIVVENNQINISFPPGVSVWNCSDCKVRLNTVQTIPGSRFRANATFKGSTGLFCGNRVIEVPKNIGNLPC
jgi:polygalacturonase